MEKSDQLENKYYIPQIEEFCVGFEYERFIPRTNATEEECWEKIGMSVNYLTLDEIDEEIIEKEIRVKYLSAEDIVDLGFIKDKKDPNKFDFILGTKFILNHYNLYLSDTTGRTIITSNDLTRAYEYGVGPKEYTLFNGKIKNKSELKKVLNQIGVL